MSDEFEKGTKPTVAQVKAVYESMDAPSLRGCEDLMKRRGFDISFGTIQRYRANGWKTAAEVREEKKAAELATTAAAPAQVLATLSPEEKTQAALDMTAVFPDVEKLKAMDAATLQTELKRQVMVTSIIGLQVAAFRAETLVPMGPKDFGLMVSELAAAIKDARIVDGAKQPKVPGDDATVIDAEVIEVTAPVERPVSATVASLQRFRAKTAGSNG